MLDDDKMLTWNIRALHQIQKEREAKGQKYSAAERGTSVPHESSRLTCTFTSQAQAYHDHKCPNVGQTWIICLKTPGVKRVRAKSEQ